MPSIDITRLLNRAADGDGAAATELWTAIHREVHAIAVRTVQGESAAFNLEASALVTEAFLKVRGKRNEPWESRRHFFGAIARAMEQFLIDTARVMQARKVRIDFVTDSVMLLKQALNGEGEAPKGDALDLLLQFGKLEAESLLSATVLRLRYQFGMTQAQVASALELTEEQVDHYSRFGRAFIRERMARGEQE